MTVNTLLKHTDFLKGPQNALNEETPYNYWTVFPPLDLASSFFFMPPRHLHSPKNNG